MRSPEHRYPYTKSAQTYEEELRYKTPGAFTVLPPESELPPDPPSAPQPYRLTPSSRRHRNLAFAILPDAGSRPGSRSPSPTGRVSPFKGRGFNPAGSRHASPAPSPPPEEKYATFTESPRHSKIPKLTRRGSAAAFGEKITDYHQSSPNKRKLHSQFSQSLTNLANSRQRLPSNRPPPSPRRPPGYKNPSIQRLSPIVGSSPEPSQSQSSPRYTNTRSQPSSRFSSPIRSHSFVHNKPPARGSNKPASKAPSRNISRDPSPSQNPTSPTRIPIKKYNNVQAKVNSYHKAKPKVPPKPQVLTDDTTEDSDKNTVTNNNNNNNNRRRVLDRKESVRTNSKNNVLSRTTSTRNVISKSNNNSAKTGTNNNSSKNGSNNATNKTGTNNNNNNNNNKQNKTNNKSNNNDAKSTSENNSESKKTEKEETLKKHETPVKLSDLLQPSTTAVVSSTTSTVTQPLKIEAKIEPAAETNGSKAAKETAPVAVKNDNNQTISPIVDGRVLSATSVSNAMNKMNDTVLNTQTLMKEHGLPKLSPAASTIIAMSNEVAPHNTNRALDTKNATTALPSVETNARKPNNELNHVTSTGIIPARVLDQHVQNNMTSLMSPEHLLVGNSVQKSVNERIKEARTVVAHDVKPIKITVKEKPMDVEVQSGNIRFDTSNGLNERPGLPPPNQASNESPPQSQEPEKTNCCTRFFTTCKKKMTCKCCKKKGGKEQAKKIDDDENETKPGCFNCRKKKPDVTINIEGEEPKRSCWDRIKCCGKNKVGDTTGCFPTGKRKDSWTERRDSILSDPPAKKSKCSCCTGFFRKLFCLDRCRKKPKKIIEDEASRRASMISKKKSLTPSVPREEAKPKIDLSLVEHASQMKGAIPVLPIYLAWFCLVMNCIAPGTGTVFSGMFCLCIGKPRFSQKDGPRPRIGSFIINLIIGFGQFFTVLFCLVGWGWSIWWGLIMIRIAKKHKKIKALEAAEAEQQQQEGSRPVQQNHHDRDPERGS